MLAPTESSGSRCGRSLAERLQKSRGVLPYRERAPAERKTGSRRRLRPVDSDFEKAKELVEATIAKIGLDPATTRTPCPNDSQAAWALKRGSASVLVTVTHHENEGAATIRVVSPVVTLPAGPNQAPLLRRLLELNAG